MGYSCLSSSSLSYLLWINLQLFFFSAVAWEINPEMYDSCTTFHMLFSSVSLPALQLGPIGPWKREGKDVWKSVPGIDL
jgi:hypothetical protein